MIIVHHLDDSGSRHILRLLKELRFPCEIGRHKRDSQTRLAPPELKRIHALGKSPVVRDNGKVIAGSGAIIDYVLRNCVNGRLASTPSAAHHDSYVHRTHYAKGSGIPALIVRVDVARVGETAASGLPRLDAEFALQLLYLDDASKGHQHVLGDVPSAIGVRLSFIGELAGARFSIDGHPDGCGAFESGQPTPLPWRRAAHAAWPRRDA
jgi:glutathione S-transferase